MRSLLVVSGLGDGVEIGAGFHFDNGDIIFGIGIDQSFVFQESSEDRNCLLIG